MRLRAIAGALGLALVLILLPATLSDAEYRGTDMWTNLVPPGPGGLADKHPISYFQLDYHVKGITASITSGVDTNDQPAQFIQLLANVFFVTFIFAMRVAISAFDWAFNMDLIGGRKGALTPVGKAGQDLWFSTFLPFMKTAILCLGIWFIYKTVTRKFGEAGIGLLRSVVLSAIAIAIIFNFSSTVGALSSVSNSLAGGIASSTTGANGGVSVSDRLFQTFIYNPWIVLNFGGLNHCVDWGNKDADGFPRQATSLTKSGDKECRNNAIPEHGKGGYAQRFLRYAPGSKARDREYTALVNAKIPDANGLDPAIAQGIGLDTPADPNQFNGYHVDKADAPAADMMQAQGALQRLGYVFLLGVGIIGAIGFLAMICLASLFAQVGFMACLVAMPVVAIAAIFPATHGFVYTVFKWAGRFLIAKVMYALLLACALAVSAALMVSGSVIGYLPAFVGQGVIFGGLFLKRRALVEAFTSRREYRHMERFAQSSVGSAAGAAVSVASAPLAAAGAVAAAGKKRMSNIDEERQQTHAPKPSGSGRDTSKDDAKSASAGTPRPDSTSPPASAGREYSPNPISETPAPETSTTVDSINHSPSTDAVPKGEQPVPNKSFQEDLEKARSEQAPAEQFTPRGSSPPPPRTEQLKVFTPRAAPEPNGNGRPEPFEQALERAHEQERNKTP